MKHTLFAVPALVCGFAIAGFAADLIPAGTQVAVRTNDRIRINSPDGRVYTGTVVNDVTDTNGNVIITRGSTAELLARRVDNREMQVDLDSISVGGRRYAVEASTDVNGGNRRDGLGKNKRTGEFVGGGAVLGTLLGAIAGGGRGAAIGAASGAAVGGGTQVLTRGRGVDVPSESVLTFRLERPLSISERDLGVDRNGRHYHDRY